MTDEEACERLRQLADGEPEGEHQRADNLALEILGEAGYPKFVEAWREMAQNWWWA